MSNKKHHIDRKQDVQQELDELAPMLSQLSKQERHKAPDTYFDGLNDRLLERIKQVEKPVTGGGGKIISLWSRMRTPQFAVAAVALVICSLATALLVYNNEDTVATDSFTLASLSDEELNSALFTVEEYDAAAIVAVGTLAQLENDFTYVSDDIKTSELDPLFDHLDNMDEELILEELL